MCPCCASLSLIFINYTEKKTVKIWWSILECDTYDCICKYFRSKLQLFFQFNWEKKLNSRKKNHKNGPIGSKMLERYLDWHITVQYARIPVQTILIVFASIYNRYTIQLKIAQHGHITIHYLRISYVQEYVYLQNVIAIEMYTLYIPIIDPDPPGPGCLPEGSGRLVEGTPLPDVPLS